MSWTRRFLPYLFLLIGVACCGGCQPGAGSVEIWTVPKQEGYGGYDEPPISVAVGQTITFDGHRELPGTDEDVAIKPIRNFKLHCKPADSVSFDKDKRTMTFLKSGKIDVWLVESAPAFAFQSQQPEDQWDQENQKECRSNTLHFEAN